MSITGDASTSVLTRWHEAVNMGDIEGAASLCTEDVAVLGPRGVGHGRDLLRAWLTRSGIRLTPLDDLEGGDGRFVIHERAQWTTPNAPTNAPSTEPAETWCVFEVSSGLVSSIARYETAAEAETVT